MPAELGDPGALDRIRHRARLRRLGSAWLRPDGPPVQRVRDPSDHHDHVLPVIGETRTKIRVVADHDDARLAVWIPRDDTWPVIAMPLELGPGVSVVRGAPVSVIGEGVVRLADPGVRVERAVAPAMIARVWLAGPGDPAVELDASANPGWTAPADPRTHALVTIGTDVRARPDRAAPAVARIEQPDVVAVVVAPHGDWREIIVPRRYATIRGFVAERELVYTTGLPAIGGTGSGWGFGSSHRDRIDVPAGACLYDAADGQVVGVQLVASTRIGQKNPPWPMVFVTTAWSTAELHVHDLGDDPAQPRLESCTAGIVPAPSGP